METTHLWHHRQDYYCSTSEENGFNFLSFIEFEKSFESGNFPDDLLFFRYDWSGKNHEELTLSAIHQEKHKVYTFTISVNCEKDEQAVISFLVLYAINLLPLSLRMKFAGINPSKD